MLPCKAVHSISYLSVRSVQQDTSNKGLPQLMDLCDEQQDMISAKVAFVTEVCRSSRCSRARALPQTRTTPLLGPRPHAYLHSIWLLFHSSCASLSVCLYGCAYSRRGLDTVTAMCSRRVCTLASSISTCARARSGTRGSLHTVQQDHSAARCLPAVLVALG
jgi:hypothetical protein